MGCLTIKIVNYLRKIQKLLICEIEHVSDKYYLHDEEVIYRKPVTYSLQINHCWIWRRQLPIKIIIQIQREQ